MCRSVFISKFLELNFSISFGWGSLMFFACVEKTTTIASTFESWGAVFHSPAILLRCTLAHFLDLYFVGLAELGLNGWEFWGLLPILLAAGERKAPSRV